EDAGVHELELGRLAAQPSILLDQAGVREFILRILVERLGIAVRGRRVEIEVTLLHVLAVIALRPRESEQTLLEDRIASVPQGERETRPSLAVGETEQAVFAPAIGPASCVIVREIVPGRAARRVVLTHRAPLTLGEVGAPALPVLLARGVLGEAAGFGREIRHAIRRAP